MSTLVTNGLEVFAVAVACAVLPEGWSVATALAGTVSMEDATAAVPVKSAVAVTVEAAMADRRVDNSD